MAMRKQEQEEKPRGYEASYQLPFDDDVEAAGPIYSAPYENEDEEEELNQQVQ